MALAYRNKYTGKVAVMAEAKEVEAELGPKAALHARRTLEKMDEGRKWERLVGDAQIEAAQSEWDRRQVEVAARRRSPAPTPVVVVGQQAGAVGDEPDRIDGDGVRATGGGWFEVVVGGEVVDRVRGRNAAEAELARHTSTGADE